jgi:hypothetical protein
MAVSLLKPPNGGFNGRYAAVSEVEVKRTKI